MWRKKILGYSAHVSVSSVYGVIEDSHSVARQVEEIPGIQHAVPYIETLVLLRSGDYLQPALVSGYNPDELGLVNTITNHITSGAFDLSEGNVIVGIDLAASLGISVNDTILVYTPKCVTSEDELHLPEELTVSGIFDVGMSQYDERFVLTSLETARELHGIETGAVELRVTTVDYERAHEFARHIQEKLGPEFRTRTWRTMRQDLFGALTVEKNLMRFLLALIAVVAFFCVANTLIVITVQKTSEIGVLKALGFSASKIMGVFIWHGMIQCIIGTFCGIGTGLLVLLYRNDILDLLSAKLDFELFPQSIYMLDRLPATTTFSDVATISGLVIVLCLLATIIPAAYAASRNPVEAMRNE